MRCFLGPRDTGPGQSGHSTQGLEGSGGSHALSTQTPTGAPLHADATAAAAQTPPSLGGLGGPPSAIMSFVVPFVMRHRSERLSPAGAPAGRHL